MIKISCGPQSEDIAMADRGTGLLRFAVGPHWSRVKLLEVVLAPVVSVLSHPSPVSMEVLLCAG